MQEEGHKIVEQQEAAETAKTPADSKAVQAMTVRHAYRVGARLCLDAQGGLIVEACNGKRVSQQWALDAQGRLLVRDGRCVSGGELVKCSGGSAQKWLHDNRGRLRNQAQQCLQAREEKAGAPVTAAACSGVPTQVWAQLALGR